MSTHVDWPADALEGTPILEKHDLEMPEMMFRPSHQLVQEQRLRKRMAPARLTSHSIVRMHHKGLLSITVLDFSIAVNAVVSLVGSSAVIYMHLNLQKYSRTLKVGGEQTISSQAIHAGTTAACCDDSVLSEASINHDECAGQCKTTSCSGVLEDSHGTFARSWVTETEMV